MSDGCQPAVSSHAAIGTLPAMKEGVTPAQWIRCAVSNLLQCGPQALPPGLNHQLEPAAAHREKRMESDKEMRLIWNLARERGRTRGCEGSTSGRPGRLTVPLTQCRRQRSQDHRSTQPPTPSACTAATPPRARTITTTANNEPMRGGTRKSLREWAFWCQQWLGSGTIHLNWKFLPIWQKLE